MKLKIVIMMFIISVLFSACAKGLGGIQQEPETTDSHFVEEKVFSDFVYEAYDSYIKITGYNGAESIVAIPESIDGKPITVIEAAAFYRCYSITSVNIPKAVTYIGDDAFFRCSDLQNITVDDDNSKYCDIDGVLFSRDKTELIAYPEGKMETQYTVPDSVTKIEGNVFGYKTNLKTIDIPSSVVEMPSHNIFVYPDEIMLLVAPESAAEAYAKEQKISCKTKTN